MAIIIWFMHESSAQIFCGLEWTLAGFRSLKHYDAIILESRDITMNANSNSGW
jgi:hypothetical protein